MKTVKAAVVAAGMSVAAMDGARAQMIVFDPQAVAQQMQQLQQQVQQLSTLKQQLEQGQQLYSSLNRLTDVNSVASLLSRPEIRSVLPTDYKQIQSLFSGSGGGSFGTASSFLSGNSHYTSAGNDFYSQEIARLAKSTAGGQSLAQSIYDAATKRMDGIEQLRQRIGTSADPKEILDLQARISAEQGFLQIDVLRMQALGQLQQAEVTVSQQRREEEQRRQIDSFRDALR
jgi:type IV secretion system protein VirB5